MSDSLRNFDVQDASVRLTILVFEARPREVLSDGCVRQLERRRDQNGFTLLGLDPTYQDIIKGLIILTAVGLDAWTRNKI